MLGIPSAFFVACLCACGLALARRAARRGPEYRIRLEGKPVYLVGFAFPDRRSRPDPRVGFTLHAIGYKVYTVYC